MKRITINLIVILICMCSVYGCREATNDPVIGSDRIESVIVSEEGGQRLVKEDIAVSGMEAAESEETIGDDPRAEFITPYHITYYGIDTFLFEITGHDKMEEWIEQFETPLNPDGRSKWECNIYNAITELNIPREEFIKGNKGIAYTDKQIDALYSGDKKLINEAFANEYALVVSGNIYTPVWLSAHTIQDYEKEGITRAILEMYLDKINIGVLKKEFERINGRLNEMKEY